tara:strand:- start:490 stop:864 length:375 start_codon:yes stop_codon:yes gene_type:complete
MNKKELKTILKPLIKQCIKECILEEGVLSGLITEVAKGLNRSSQLVENKSVENRELREKYEKDRQERIKRLNESTRIEAPVFQETEEIVESRGRGALSGTDPNDPGVDISGILNVADGRWKKLI